jgi:signal peptidase I
MEATSMSAWRAAGRRLVLDVLELSGIAQLRVSGSSMLPVLMPGDIVTIQRAELPQVIPGDIIIFEQGEYLIAHRVLEKRSGKTPYLVTQGDSGSRLDAPVFSDSLLGRVTSIMRNRTQIEPSRTILGRSGSLLLRRSQFLTRSFLWTLNRRRFLRKAQCAS